MKRSAAADGLASTAGGDGSVAQFKGPRDYAKDFKAAKTQVVDWLRDSEIVGLDLSADADATEEEDANIGWHHMYPYSHLWDDHSHHKLADHGANLKLGPMKNRLGDPGHEIDVSYSKAVKREGGGSGASIKPAYTTLGGRLLKELEERPIVGVGERAPKNNIDISGVKYDDLANETLSDTTNIEDYWSEWYLSENIRKLKLSDAKVLAAISKLKNTDITAKKTEIVASLNAKLDSLRYTYVTHRPSTPEGGVLDFQPVPVEETGIPSSKLSKIGVLGEKLIARAETTYADLVNNLLVEEKWVIRGSQGSAHNIAAQFKDKMKAGNMELIETLLRTTSLEHLKTLVEAEYKRISEENLSKYDDMDDKVAPFFALLKTRQIAKGTVGLAKEDIAAILRETVGDIISQTKTVDKAVPPDDAATSFEITYPEGDTKALAAVFDKFIRNDLGDDDIPSVARTIISTNARSRDDYGEDEGKKWVFAHDGKNVLSNAHIATCLRPLLVKSQPETEASSSGSGGKKKTGGTKSSRGKATPSRSAPKVDSVGGFVIEIVKALAVISADYKEYWQEPDYEEEAVTEDFKAADVAARMATQLSMAGRKYVRHISAITSKPAKYGQGIEAALQQPGRGYTDPTLAYPLPKAIAEASPTAAWTFSVEQEGLFRKEWYTKAFTAFLRGFIASDTVQESLLDRAPR
jgi:hypothetical protein